MEMTTIAISKEVKNKLNEFGNKGESHSQIVLNLLTSAGERQLQDLLMDERDTISIEDALKKSRKRWSK